VRINAVGPGYVDTPMLARKDDAARHKLAQAHPLGRMARAGEIAEMVAWLCSAKASFVTGAYYPVAGGYLAQ
jgi:NAD(P)-dependent dehydrogenase (short-subunit alcohol dehydrogenase family)